MLTTHSRIVDVPSYSWTFWAPTHAGPFKLCLIGKQNKEEIRGLSIHSLKIDQAIFNASCPNSYHAGRSEPNDVESVTVLWQNSIHNDGAFKKMHVLDRLLSYL